jgi:hypothetical protein
MCSPLDPLSCTDAITKGITDKAADVVTGLVTDNLDALLRGFNDQLHVAIKAMATTLAGWILAPSTKVCADAAGTDWMAACGSGTSPAAQLRGWMLPLTILIAVVGITWQAITMAISRKGEPLLIVGKGLFTTAVWGAVGIAGTQLALRAGDSYSYWILQKAIFGDSLNPVDDLGTAIANMSAGASYTATLLLILLQLPALFVTIAQIILMIFREGAVVILAGQLQLAAAGSFTRLTSGWLGKVTGWMLALIAYKPVAASVYAVAFLLLGDGLRNLVMGLAVLIMSLVAMPALMKFFNWGVGSISAGGGSGLWMFGTSLAAGMHAASTMRGLGGGHRAGDHAAYMADHGPGPGPASNPPAPGGGTPPPPPAPSGIGPAGTAASMGGSGTSGASSAAAGGASAAAGVATGGATFAAQAVVGAVDEAKQRIHRAASDAGDAMGGSHR